MNAIDFRNVHFEVQDTGLLKYGLILFLSIKNFYLQPKPKPSAYLSAHVSWSAYT